jgi:hypothetical protein
MQGDRKHTFSFGSSIKPLRIELIFAGKADKSEVFRHLSESPDLTIDFLRKRKSAAWDWSAVTANPALSFRAKVANPDLPWTAIECRYGQEAPPLEVLCDSPGLPWSYTNMALRYTATEMLALIPRPSWIDQNGTTISSRAVITDVLKHVSDPLGPLGG